MVKAAILAGGRGRRLGGAAKALLELGGQTILARQTEILRPLFSEVLLVVGHEEPYRAHASSLGLELVRDREPARGPLAGLQAALDATDADSLVVVGCDLPFLDPKLLQLVRDDAPSAEAVVPRVGARPQPLHARYARSILSHVEARLRRDELRLLSLLDDLEVAWLDEPRLRAIDPGLRGLTNLNTPDDLARARAALAEN